MSVFRTIIKIVAAIIILVIVCGAAYIIYVVASYERIEDEKTLEIEYLPNPLLSSLPGQADGKMLRTGTGYTALTFNIGFGAYDHDFSFFMDKGYMKDGTETVGLKSRAASKDAAIENTEAVISLSLAEKADILLFQEVDVAADRSYNVDQRQSIIDAFYKSFWPEVVNVASEGTILYWNYATNFHTPYLFYPPTKPIGFIRDSGLLTLSHYRMDSAVRRSFPVSDAFPTKFFDLDRCFSITRMPVADGGTLVLINTHMSAYDEGGVIRKGQMEMLSALMETEYAAGNWVIVGGDFNHALGGSEDGFMGQMGIPPWVQPFDESMVPKGFRVVIADNNDVVATDRDSSVPWSSGVNYQVVLDGFMVSDNVKATALNVNGEYKGSDHNPVRLSFTLQPQADESA